MFMFQHIGSHLLFQHRVGSRSRLYSPKGLNMYVGFAKVSLEVGAAVCPRMAGYEGGNVVVCIGVGTWGVPCRRGQE